MVHAVYGNAVTCIIFLQVIAYERRQEAGYCMNQMANHS
jgi:hypothetical protein